MKKALATVIILLSGILLQAGEPFFSAFKENYVTTGIPLNAKPDWDTNDILFQASVKMRVLSIKDWNFYAGYTQKCIWEIYKPSNPMASSIYNVSAFASHGGLNFGYEHRSNGLAGSDSRSLNYAFVSYAKTFSDIFSAKVSGRFGGASIGNDVSLELYNRYLGYVNVAACLHSRDKRFMGTLSLTPIINEEVPCNINAEIAYKPLKDIEWFHIIVRYHYGYDENQLDCANPDVFLKHMLRFGVAFQPSDICHKLFD